MGERQAGDDLLLARLAAGDDRALEAAYDQHAGMVFGIARRVCGEDEAARDVTQDVFTSLWVDPGRIDLSRGSVRAFLAVLAHRRAVDAVRRRARRDRTELRAASTEACDHSGHEEQVASRLDSDRRQAALRSVLDVLPAEQREAVELAYYGGHTYREVANLLGIPEGTAKSRLRLAMRRLRSHLESAIHEATP